MAAALETARQNLLLGLLPARDFEAIGRDLFAVSLSRGTVLAEPGQAIDDIYFLTTGIGSVLVHTPNGHRVEAGLFGREGYVPTSAVSGVRQSPHEVTVQVDAHAFHMEFDMFRARMEAHPAFFTIMMRAIEAFSIQLAYTAASNAIHDVNVRLARWLLMCHDRIGGEDIRLTHDFLSMMLAVRRSSVTTALHILEGHGFVRSTRGSVLMRDRAGMERFAADAYGQPEAALKRVFSDIA